MLLRRCLRKIHQSTILHFPESSQPPPPPKTTHFGFKTVLEEDKQRLVKSVFENVAMKYDIMNDVMSMGIHRLWKDSFVSKISPTANMKVVDVAGGTGDIAFRILDKARASAVPAWFYGPIFLFFSSYSTHVTVVDINGAMLSEGQKRASKLGYSNPLEISWLEADAECLPLENDSVDCYTISFGIRNCTNIPNVLNEAYRVLKPGGRFVCLEFSHVHDAALKSLYDLFSFQVIPRMGQLIANDQESYQYLVESIRKFPVQPIFADMIRAPGFKHVEWEDFSAGIAAMHSGWKI